MPILTALISKFGLGRLIAVGLVVVAVAGAGIWIRGVFAERDTLRIEVAEARRVAEANAAAAAALQAEIAKVSKTLAARERRLADINQQSTTLSNGISSHAQKPDFDSPLPAVGRTYLDGLRRGAAAD